jgi:hypothetical protein
MSISWEYLAGMIDADGSIGTTTTGSNKNIVGRITVANTNQSFLYTLKENFGGSVSIRKTGAKEGWKPYGSITWSNRKAENILINVIPFLIIKKQQAELCLELIQMRNLTKTERYAYIPRPVAKMTGRSVAELKPEIRAREEEIGALIRVLNTRGVPVHGKP